MKKYLFSFFLALIFILTSFAAIMIYIDPYFHYHKPLAGFTYVIDNQRYQNDGIQRNFDYNAMIIGTSMTENFKTSEFDELFNVNSIKTSYSGASFQELNESIERAISYNDDLKIIIRALDMNRIYLDSEITQTPNYLYDNYYINDLEYIFNKEVFFDKTLPTIQSYGTEFITSFDDYSRWHQYYTFGKDEVLSFYEKNGYDYKLPNNYSNENDILFIEHLENTILSTVRENPDITFYYFISPYSIAHWKDLNNTDILDEYINTERILIESLLQYQNCKLYSFNNNFKIITDFNNYKDKGHYGENINSYILKAMVNEEYLLSDENYEEYLREISDFYTNYDYEMIFN